MTTVKHKYWWPVAISEQKVLLQNFYLKIEGNADSLGLTEGQVQTILKICEDILAALEYSAACKTSAQAATAWTHLVLNGQPDGQPVPAPPVFPQNAPMNPEKGLIKKFAKFRDQILLQPGYTLSIGEDLGLIGAVITPKPEVTMKPVLKVTSLPGNLLQIQASLQGMAAMRLQYSTNGGDDYRDIDLFTNKPGTVHIEPQVPGQPEKGLVRAIFVNKSHEIGQYSDPIPVTIY